MRSLKSFTLCLARKEISAVRIASQVAVSNVSAKLCLKICKGLLTVYCEWGA